MSNVVRCKCLIVGDSTVGKTSIVRALTSPSNQFSNRYLMTTDIAVTLKAFKAPNSEQSVELFLFDCSGKEFYRDLYQKVWSSLDDFPMIVAVVDATNQQTFNSLQNWLTDVIGKEKAIGIVLANKMDLNDRLVVTGDDGHQLAKKFKMRFFECSAKNKFGIEEAFLHLISTWLESHNQSNGQIKFDST